MISKETYDKIQKYKKMGVTQRETAKRLGISKDTARKWWEWEEEAFCEKEQNQLYYLDQYREFILSILRVCPQTRETNILFRLQEAFPDFQCKRATFYRYMKKLREQTGYAQFKERQTGFREALPPGYEAQVDFGQYKMTNMYGSTVRVYFFCMILSYSKMAFVFFSSDPFTTETAVQAHRYAFRYFGGRTQTIMYDQDKVFVVSENLGNIIFVKGFEDFVKEIGYQVVLCRPRDPQTKGRVEGFVKYVKEAFLQGRVYTGIDALNSAALAWLDRAANNRVDSVTKKSARELFYEESQYLQKTTELKYEAAIIRSVTDRNAVLYENHMYELPRERVRPYDKIRIEEREGVLVFYQTESGAMVYKCRKASNDERTVLCSENDTDMESVSVTALRMKFEGSKAAMDFFDAVEAGIPRYKTTQLRRINTISKSYTTDQMCEAFKHCVQAEKCTAFEAIAFLIYKYGIRKSRYKMSSYLLGQCKTRALEIAEEEHGKRK